MQQKPALNVTQLWNDVSTLAGFRSQSVLKRFSPAVCHRADGDPSTRIAHSSFQLQVRGGDWAAAAAAAAAVRLTKTNSPHFLALLKEPHRHQRFTAKFHTHCGSQVLQVSVRGPLGFIREGKPSLCSLNTTSLFVASNHLGAIYQEDNWMTSWFYFRELQMSCEHSGRWLVVLLLFVSSASCLTLLLSPAVSEISRIWVTRLFLSARKKKHIQKETCADMWLVFFHFIARLTCILGWSSRLPPGVRRRVTCGRHELARSSSPSGKL